MATGRLGLSPVRPIRFRLPGVPVFLYHGLSHTPPHEVHPREHKYWVLTSQFREHLERIGRGGYRVISLAEVGASAGSGNHAAHSVALTFDDGLVSDYQIAYPLLAEAGFRAVFFVNPGTIGQPGLLTWCQMTEMQRAGMSFQSHGYDHVDFSRLASGLLGEQLRRSKRVLEDRLGARVDFLSIPYGLWNPRILKVALQEGYRAVCTSRSWPARAAGRVIHRVAVFSNTSPEGFSRLLAGEPLGYAARAARAGLFWLPRQVLLRLFPSRLTVRVLEERN